MALRRRLPLPFAAMSVADPHPVDRTRTGRSRSNQSPIPGTNRHSDTELRCTALRPALLGEPLRSLKSYWWASKLLPAVVVGARLGDCPLHVVSNSPRNAGDRRQNG